MVLPHGLDEEKLIFCEEKFECRRDRVDKGVRDRGIKRVSVRENNSPVVDHAFL